MSVKILVGDALQVLRTMPAASVHCIVTSPPYYKQRAYLGDQEGSAWPEGFDLEAARACEMGNEDDPGDFIDSMARVFREARRVLRPDGTLWLNMGDTAASGGRGGGGSFQHERRAWKGRSGDSTANGWREAPKGLKRKDMIGIPWTLAFAMRAGWAACTTCNLEQRADLWPVWQGRRRCLGCAQEGYWNTEVRQTEQGWFLRQENIWSKPNAFPESVVDRTTRAHEQFFMFSRSGKDTIWRSRDTKEWSHCCPDLAETIPNPKHATDPEAPAVLKRWMGMDYYYDLEAVMEPSSPNTHARAARGRSKDHKWADGGPGDQTIAKVSPSAGRMPGAGPKSIAMENAGKVLPMRNRRSVWDVHTAQFSDSHYATFPPKLVETPILAGCPRGGVVLDPFAGSGTVAQVAAQHGRQAILIDLDPRNVRMIESRLRNLQVELDL